MSSWQMLLGDHLKILALQRSPSQTQWSSQCKVTTPSISLSLVFLTLYIGDRPLPSCLGGGDLDGDSYSLIPLIDMPRFQPKRWVLTCAFYATELVLLEFTLLRPTIRLQ